MIKVKLRNAFLFYSAKLNNLVVFNASNVSRYLLESA